MTSAARFRPNSPPVVQETLDRETIMVNLDTGTYYSLNPVGTHVWVALEGGASIDQVSQMVAGQSGAEAELVADSLRAFLGELLKEQLLVPRADDVPVIGAGPEWPAGLAFEPPALSRYTDMQELLLLDPVHDVGAAGWPEAR